jgi:Initiator Replication protein
MKASAAEQKPLFELEKRLVTQGNPLARSAQQMDILEKRLVLFAISQLQWDQDDFTTVEIRMTNVVQALGKKNKNIYKLAQTSARGLLKRTIFIGDEDGGWTEFQWVSEMKRRIIAKAQELL